MALHFIASATASGSATLEFTSGIDSTFNEYQFQFVNMHPASEDGDNRQFMFQANAVGESGFNETITSTYIETYHNEAGGTTSGFYFSTARNQAQGTGYQQLMYGLGADSDQSCSGILTLYEPSSTTYTKQFTVSTVGSYFNNFTMQTKVSGYINTAAAVDEISFKMSSGNIDAGTIYMYGVGH